MKTKIGLSLMMAALTGAVLAAVPQVLTYRGVLTRTSGYDRPTALELTFRLYDSKAPEKALWARTMRVPVDTNGVFYAELSDANGNDPDGIGFTLADAMGAIRGTPEIGLTPPKAAELKPRQQLATGVRAARAARAKAADVVLAPTGAYAAGVFIDTAAAQDVTVLPGAALAAFPARCTLTPVKTPDSDGNERKLGGAQSEIIVRDMTAADPNWPVSFSRSNFKYTTAAAPCDMILTYEGDDGAFSVIVPKDGIVEGKDSGVQMIYGTAFGNMNAN